MTYFTLTPREAEIAELVAIGLTSDEICNKLFIQHSTLKSHIHKIYSKFCVADFEKSGNDPAKRVKFVRLWLKEKYGNDDFIIAQNESLKIQTRSLQTEIRQLLESVKNALKLIPDKSEADKAKEVLKDALLNYVIMRDKHE